MAMGMTVMLYIGVVVCSLSNTPASCSGNETDKLALISFKGSIDQDPFGALSSWNDSVHYCDWKGITCSRRHRDRVLELKLRSQGLVGSLSPHIGNLSFLQSIDLQTNSFNGPIPQEICLLFRLKTIQLNNNSFSGRIPSNLSSCSNLEYLNLIDNHLVGNIPAELGSLVKLKALGLGMNRISGTIPPSLGNLSSLSIVSFAYCNLHGEIPDDISKLAGLTFLSFGSNNLLGQVPSGLFNISSMDYFSVVSNQLVGSIPSDIGSTLSNLRAIHLSLNSFTGTIPNSLVNASGLEEIGLGGNDFTGPVPKDLGKLLHLQLISIANNRFEDDFSFISSLTNCTALQFIYGGGTRLRGSLPDTIGNLSTMLSVLAISDSQLLQGSIPLGIGDLVNLTYLDMGFNHMSGPIPATIGKLHHLQELYLGGNNFTELPSSLGNLSLLNLLHLEQNNIYGSIPSSIGNCRNLLDVNISYNNLTGSIPPEIMSLSSISISLNLAHNGLTGVLPSEVGSLKNLVELDLSNNKLSGLIPNSLQNCLSLELLLLGGNSFEGEIPKILGELRGLTELDLSHNNFSGLIPSYLGDLQLDKLNLSFNQLHGEVPTKGVFKNGSTISVVGNADLCGGIPDFNLPSCSSSKPQKNKLSYKLKVILSVVVVFIVICLTSLVCFFILSHRRRRASRDKASGMPSFKNQLLRVSYADILKATDGFSEDNLVGVGNYGSVYRGILSQNLRIVAVKVLNLQTKGASKSFMSECKALRSIRHRNLLKIVSACSSLDYNGNEFKALICEFMANGSLEKWLHQDEVENDRRGEESRDLKFIQRLNIAIDVASALEYLHCQCDSTIIHGDLKPSNVLLDDEMTAHVGDFGLAKIISTVSSSSEVEQHHTNSTGVRGTIGYVAPEYGLGNTASKPADVYSYGILLLEMFTGKKPTDNLFKDGTSLHQFVKSALPDQAMEIVNSCILFEHKAVVWINDVLVSVLRIGLACSMESPRDRMQIQELVIELCKIKRVYESNGRS